MIKIGLIGLGGMGSGHATTLAKMPDVQIPWVCDLIAAKAEKVGSAIGARTYTDYRQGLDAVDAVWVCTEPFNRADIVTTAAAAGKHIFTEKPIGATLRDADAMIAAARKANVVYMLGYCLRYWNPYRLIRDTFASGELGRLVTCWTRRFMPCDMRQNRWYGHQAQSGGVVLDFGSHDIDWLRWIGGDVQTVMARTARVRENVDADEHGSLMMGFRNGGYAAIDVSWSSYLGESSFGVVGTKGSMIVGNDGQVRKQVGEQGPPQVLEANATVSIDPNGNLGQDPHSRVQGENMYAHFVRCVTQRLRPISDAEEGRRALLTWMAALESARSGQAVAVGK